MHEEEILSNFSTFISQITKCNSIEQIDFSQEYPFPLFHGTDKKILSLSNQEIRNARIYTNEGLKLLYNLLIENNFDPCSKEFSVESPEDPDKEIKRKKLNKFNEDGKKLFGKEIFNNICNSMIHVPSILKGNTNLWSYKNFYVTTGPRRAYNYAAMSNWFGELGYFTHWLYVAVKELNLKFNMLSKAQEDSIAFISSITNNTPEPIILYINHIKTTELETENKFEKTLKFPTTQNSFKVIKDIDIHSFPSMELSKQIAYSLDEKLELLYRNIKI